MVVLHNKRDVIKADVLLRGSALDGKVRVFAIRMKNLIQQLSQKQQMSPTVTMVVGEVVAATAMMAAMLKGTDTLTVQIKGTDGPIGQIRVEATADGVLRAYVSHPAATLCVGSHNHVDMLHAFGKGASMCVMKHLGLKQSYCSNTTIFSNRTAENFNHYFETSDQTVSFLNVGLSMKHNDTVCAAGGYVVQCLPVCAPHETKQIQESFSSFPSLNVLLKGNCKLDHFLRLLYPDFRVTECMEICFSCKCSRKYVIGRLLDLGYNELNDMIQQDGFAEVICHFCREKYFFTEKELIAIIDNCSHEI